MLLIQLDKKIIKEIIDKIVFLEAEIDSIRGNDSYRYRESREQWQEDMYKLLDKANSSK